LQAPTIIQKLFPSITWRFSGAEKKIYLTFDDGPIPEITPWVLELLRSYNAKATFFCIGNNVLKNNVIYQEILNEGHQVGNHTHNHLNGWNVKNKNYFEDIEECRKHVKSNLFRPPYGKIKPSQIKHLKENYRIIMWDVLSQDYDQDRTAEQCLNSVIKVSSAGSVIVFHDSLKAEKRLRGALPLVLEHFKQRGFEFARIEA